MATVARLYTFTDGTDAYGSQVEADLNVIFNAWNNHDAGTSRWNQIDSVLFKQGGNSAYPILSINSAAISTQYTMTSSTFTTVGTSTLSVSVTPKSATSKFILAYASSASVSASTGHFALYRGSSNLAGGTNSMQDIVSTVYVGISLFHIDSPATVSSTTYTVKCAIQDNSSTLTVNPSGMVTTFFVIELGF